MCEEEYVCDHQYELMDEDYVIRQGDKVSDTVYWCFYCTSCLDVRLISKNVLLA